MTERKYHFKHGDIVQVSAGINAHIEAFLGRVIAPINDLPIIGHSYMVEIVDSSNEHLPNSSYPFRAIAVPEHLMTKRE